MEEKKQGEIKYFTLRDVKDLLGKNSLTAKSWELRERVGITRRRDYN